MGCPKVATDKHMVEKEYSYSRVSTFFIIPISNYYGILPLKYDQLVEWAILDTFDTYSPAFTNCQNIDTVRSWLEKAGLEHLMLVMVIME